MKPYQAFLSLRTLVSVLSFQGILHASMCYSITSPTPNGREVTQGFDFAANLMRRNGLKSLRNVTSRGPPFSPYNVRRGIRREAGNSGGSSPGTYSFSPWQASSGPRMLLDGTTTSQNPDLALRTYSYRNHNYFRDKVKISGNPDAANEKQFLTSSEISASNALKRTTNINQSGTTSQKSDSSINFQIEKLPSYSSTAGSGTVAGTEAPVSFLGSTSRSEAIESPRETSGIFYTSESNNHHHFSGQNQYFRGQQDKQPTPVPANRGDVTTSLYARPEIFPPVLDSTPGNPSTQSIIFDNYSSSTARTYKLPNYQDNELDLYSISSLLGHRTASGDVNPASFRQPLVVPDTIEQLDCAKSLGYCDDVTPQHGYPKELLNGLLGNAISSASFKKVFGDVIDASVDTVRTQDDFTLSGRNGISAQETPLCQSHEVTIYPKAARNKDNKWMFIVNHDDYVQGVKVEKCAKEGDSCLHLDSPALGLESVCRQKYILRKLVALNPDGKSLLVLDTFKLPSCCVCYVKSGFLAERIGTSSSVPKSSAFGIGSPTEDQESKASSSSESLITKSADVATELSAAAPTTLIS